MVAIDPSGSLKHFPIPMQRFGLNSFGENLYRIVLASSRRNLVFGRWNGTGTGRAKWVQTYPQIGNEWILEKWLDAFTFAGPPSAWDDILGPYPTRGEYQMCGNTSFEPEHTNVEKLISLITAGDRHSWAEKLAACRKQAENLEREKSELRKAIILDALPAFGHAPFSQPSTGRGGAVKTSPVLRSANELGLPVPHGTPGEVTTGGSMIVPKKRKRRVA